MTDSVQVPGAATPILSIVTIVRNNRAVLDTLRSLPAVRTGAWSVLVVDGASDDGTSEAVREFVGSCPLRIEHLREPDRGISDALNKGLRRAESPWVLFLNAGDKLHPGLDLSAVLDELEASEHDVLCGDAWMEGEGRGWLSPGRWELLDRADHFWNPVCHQATFFRRESHLRHVYDARMRYTMDLDVLLRMRRDGARFARLERTVCTYSLGGLTSSDRHYVRNHLEHDLVNRLNGRIPRLGRSGSLLVRNLLTRSVRGLLGPRSTRWVRSLLGRP